MVSDKPKPGSKYGRWTVVEYAGRVQYSKCSQNSWLCQCECGAKVAVLESNLKRVVKYDPATGRASGSGGSRQCSTCARNARRKWPKSFRGYTVWRRIVSDCCESWKSPDVFAEWFAKNFRRGLRMVKIDESLPHSAENTAYVHHARRLTSTMQDAVAYCVLRGMDRASAEARVRGVSRQRAYQMAAAFRKSLTSTGEVNAQ